MNDMSWFLSKLWEEMNTGLFRPNGLLPVRVPLYIEGIELYRISASGRTCYEDGEPHDPVFTSVAAWLPLADAYGVLAHEMVHTTLSFNDSRNEGGHGPNFARHCHQIGLEPDPNCGWGGCHRGMAFDAWAAKHLAPIAHTKLPMVKPTNSDERWFYTKNCEVK